MRLASVSSFAASPSSSGYTWRKLERSPPRIASRTMPARSVTPAPPSSQPRDTPQGTPSVLQLDMTALTAASVSSVKRFSATTGGTELARRDERPVTLLGDDHALDARLEVLEIARQAEDGHDLRGHRDVEAALAGHPVSRAAQTDDEAAQRAVVHIEHAFPEDPSHVEPERIALRQMIVQHRGQ